MANMFTRDEKLALLKVLQRRINDAVEALEMGKKYSIMEMHEHNPDTDRLRIAVNGTKVGEVVLPYSRAKAAVQPGCEEQAMAYLEARGLVEKRLKSGWEKAFVKTFYGIVDAETGEDCSEFLTWLYSAPLAPRINGCKEADVKAAFAGKLDISKLDPLYLLEGAGDE